MAENTPEADKTMGGTPDLQEVSGGPERGGEVKLHTFDAADELRFISTWPR